MLTLVGNPLRIACTFTNYLLAPPAPADPTSVLVRIKDPTGAVVVYDTPSPVVRDSAGVYHLDVVLGIAGTWYVRWEGAGAIVAVAETPITVAPSAVLP